MNLKLLGALTGIALAFTTAGIEPFASQKEASAETSSFLEALTVGTELMAMDDIRLARADVAKGAKVSISKLLVRQGRIAGVDVVLADGHVVKKVALSTLRDFFRIVGDRR
ncbi:MAG: hypothetical protein L6Q76_06570 [Polyangiaceae bacterium]|nr:hypothetical protein [Polyangiaceae bacterium]